MIGSLLMFDRNLFILEEAENFPFLMSSIACWTGLLSGNTIIGCWDSRRREYSESIATAMDIASTSHGDHFLHWSLNFAEWYLTGMRDLSFTAKSVCPIPGLLLAPSGLITS